MAQTASDIICRNVWAGLCHNRYIRLGILSVIVFHIFSVASKIERGWFREVFGHWTNFKAVFASLRKRTVNRHNVGNNNFPSKGVERRIYCETKIMKSLREAEQRCTKASQLRLMTLIHSVVRQRFAAGLAAITFCMTSLSYRMDNFFQIPGRLGPKSIFET